MKLVIEKFKEALTSVLPIVAIVFLVLLTPLFDLSFVEKVTFGVSSVLLIIGMTLFNIGAELSMTIMGDQMGNGLVKTKNLNLILFVGFIMGIFITIAEPDLYVLSNEVKSIINGTVFVWAVGIGVGVFLVIAILKAVFNRRLSILMLLFYMLLFSLNALACELGKNSLVPVAYDAGGVTTGPITVPFLMAFGFGIASTIGGKRSKENSFGFVALCSIGPMVVVMICMLFVNGIMQYSVDKLNYSVDYLLKNKLVSIIVEETLSVGTAFVLIFIFFMIINILIIKLPKKMILQIIAGILVTYLGLVIFLTAATVGYQPIGFSLGSQFIKADKNIAILISFVIGMTVVLAEPAVQVLTNQVEGLTGGAVSKRSMLIALSIGVGISLALSCIRILYNFSLIYYLIPGYFISLALTLFVPPLYTSIAFDSGGVASGPLTSTFILPFMIGACSAYQGDDKVLSLAFGVVAMVAMTPLITIQVLGFKSIFTKYVKDKVSLGRIKNADDNQIVYIVN